MGISLESVCDSLVKRETGKFSATSMIPVEGHSDYWQVCSMYFINKHASYKDETKALWAMKHSSVTSVADVCHHIVIVQTVATSDLFPVTYPQTLWL